MISQVTQVAGACLVKTSAKVRLVRYARMISVLVFYPRPRIRVCRLLLRLINLHALQS